MRKIPIFIITVRIIVGSLESTHIWALWQQDELQLRAISWSPDDSLVAFGTRQNKVMIYDVASQTVTHEIDTAGETTLSIAWSPDSTKLALTSSTPSTYIEIFDTTGYTPLLSLPIVGTTYQPIAWSLDGSKVVGSDGHDAQIWDAVTGQELALLEGHYNEVGMVYWSEDGTWVLTVDGGGTVRIWDAATYTLINSFQAGEGSLEAAVSPDETQVAIPYRNLTVLDLATGQIVIEFQAHLEPLIGIDWKGTHLASFGYGDTIHIWDMTTWQLDAIIPTSTFIYDVALNSDGIYLAYSGPGGTPLVSCICDFLIEDTGLRPPGIDSVRSVAWSPDDSLVAFGTRQNKVMIYDVASQTVTHEIPTTGTIIRRITWSPDSTKIAAVPQAITLRYWMALPIHLCLHFQ